MFGKVYQNLDAYFCLDYKNENGYAVQVQIFLKKTDRTYYATNLLKVKLKDGVVFREGFDDVDQFNFGSV